MKSRELKNLGIPAGDVMRIAKRTVAAARTQKLKSSAVRTLLRDLVSNPNSFLNDAVFAELATALSQRTVARQRYVPRADSAPYRQWGQNLEPESVRQLENACSLPIAVRGALMPDAHRGYGLPIGGVLATRNAVIPYAVGARDIGAVSSPNARMSENRVMRLMV